MREFCAIANPLPLPLASMNVYFEVVSIKEESFILQFCLECNVKRHFELACP